jgi:hypothetical protein
MRFGMGHLVWKIGFWARKGKTAATSRQCGVGCRVGWWNFFNGSNTTKSGGTKPWPVSFGSPEASGGFRRLWKFGRSQVGTKGSEVKER